MIMCDDKKYVQKRNLLQPPWCVTVDSPGMHSGCARNPFHWDISQATLLYIP